MSSKKTKKRGFLSKLFCKKKNPEKRVNGLTLDQVIDIACHETKLKHDPIYRQQYLNQQMVDNMAMNNAELTRHTISEAMTWLVPRLERQIEDMTEKLDKLNNNE